MEEKNEALQFAMKLIGLRKRSVFEITERLKKKKFEENVIKEVLNELNRYGYLNDEQFAESYINDRMNFRPCGRFLIKKELSEKRIAENIIERKIEELISEEKEIESAKKLAEKKLKTISNETDKSKINQKIKSYLQSKGYSFDIISRAVESEME
ncbi:regulatory protein RecX [Candidatus Parcubacteria bacterium]|nr:regulatory protein RecX [Candidatus Parcubacteria bacterium]